MYLSGFGNHHSTEAISGALPITQNSPQHCPYDLYAEQLSGAAFTRARHQNLHTWLYRTLPSAAIHPYEFYSSTIHSAWHLPKSPNPMRWSPFSTTLIQEQNFLEGLFHLSGNYQMNGYVYQCNRSMEQTYFQNRDGELLFIPYRGELRLCTEMGILEIRPGLIAVIPRGVYFKVELVSEEARGYLCENGGHPFILPELGPLGANSLAHPRHFLYPTASYEKNISSAQMICKYQDQLWISKNNPTPLNVVAWHGNYAPYLYDLSLFNTINSVSYDHPDPSIFTVLTSPSEIPGVAHLDFVIFPPRWMVAEHTFRPPYFHRNIMNEWMGLILGEYDAKQDGFLPGGSSIHNCMTGHGPDVSTYQQAISQALNPQRYENTLAFMLESNKPWLATIQAMEHETFQQDYMNCWQGFLQPNILP